MGSDEAGGRVGVVGAGLLDWHGVEPGVAGQGEAERGEALQSVTHSRFGVHCVNARGQTPAERALGSRYGP